MQATSQSHKVMWLIAGCALGIDALLALPADAAIRYTGVNLAGAEFGHTALPGVYGTNYTYPTSAEVDYYIGKGLNTFRLPFRWERLQRSQFAELHTAEMARMDAFVNYATSQGAHVIIEPHNFQRYFPDPNNFQSSTQGLVGGAAPDAAFADFWSRLAGHYQSNGRVIFNLMNEPNSMSTEQLVTSENAAIAAIRAAGASNLILVPGNQWTGAWAWDPPGGDANPALPGKQSWYGTVNAYAMLNIVDPGNNFAFDVHQYLDDNSSGTSTQIGTNGNPNNVNIGVQRLTTFTNWLKAHNLRGHLGEFAVANSRIGDDHAGTSPQIGDEAIDAMLSYIADNDDVWLGWTWWAGGPWWNNYMFTLEPTNLGQPSQADRAAMAVLQPHLAAEIVDLAGDFNRDDRVDSGDLPAWRTALGRTGLALAADGDADGDVDGADFLLWQQNVGGATPPGAVPEPATFGLLGAAVFSYAAAWAARRRASRLQRFPGLLQRFVP
jgi:endoglucanase